MTAQPTQSLRAPTRPARLRRAPRRTVGLLAVAAAAVLAAGVLAGAALLGGGSAPAPEVPGIVPLRVSSGNGIATGFAVADGRVVTVAHVLHGPVTVAGRRGRVLRVDRQSDLALLSAPAVASAGAAPRSARPVDGQHLRVVRLRDGRVSMLSAHVRRSIVAHVREAGAARAVVRPALELSARIAPGDSGAAVVSDSGELTGVVFAASRNRVGTAYAVDAGAVTHLLNRP
jgi:S1-C subfamily serine protease